MKYLLITILLITCSCEKSKQSEVKKQVKFTWGPITTKLIPASVIKDEPIGSKKIFTRYYTKLGEPIYTPQKGLTEYPAAQKTVGLDGRVISPRDGIRVVGQLSHEDFHAILAAVKGYAAPPLKSSTRTEKDGNVTHVIDPASFHMKLRSRTVHEVIVESPDFIRLNTINPRVKGHCPSGDSVELKRVDSKWLLQVTGYWIS